MVTSGGVPRNLACPADTLAHEAAAPPRPRRRRARPRRAGANGSIVTTPSSSSQTPAITPSTSRTGREPPAGAVDALGLRCVARSSRGAATTYWSNAGSSRTSACRLGRLASPPRRPPARARTPSRPPRPRGTICRACARRRVPEPLRQLLAGGRAVAGEEAPRDLLRRGLGVHALERLGQREPPFCPRREDQLAAERDGLEQVAVAAARPGVDRRQLLAGLRPVAQRLRDPRR